MESFRLLLLGVLALLCTGCAHARIIVCIAPSSPNETSESACKAALEMMYDAMDFLCTLRTSKDECLQAVEEGQAHVTIVGGNLLYSAYAKYNFAAIVAESASEDLGDASHWGVALTKRSMCASVDGDNSVGGPITGLDDSLRGKRACHAGYRTTSGWFLPVGKLAERGIMNLSESTARAEEEGVRVDAEAVKNFWEDNVCAPGSTSNGPKLDGSIYGRVGANGGGLCKQCKQGCTNDDPYAGYDGALRCIDDINQDEVTGGDIAFVKHSTVPDYDGPPLNTRKNDFVGICDAGCMTLFDEEGNPTKDGDGQFKYKKCSTGKSASNAMVVKKSFIGTSEHTKLMTAMGLQNSNSADVPANSALKNEDTVGLWSDDTNKLYKIAEPATDDGFKSFFTAYDSFREIRNSDSGLRVCISGTATPSTCEAALKDAYGRDDLSFYCMKKSEVGCLEAVRTGEAHVTVVGGNELFAAHNQYNLAAIVAEQASGDLEDASYWGVALTKRGNCATVTEEDGSSSQPGGDITGLDSSLKGKAACHTGYRKTSGWYLPVGTLAKDEVIKFSDWAQEAADHNPPVQVDAETIEKFWEDNVCAPGSTENGPLIGGGKYGEVGENGGGLCKRCKTDCTSEDPYAGYDGAVHCIDDDDGNQFTGGDIAFVKHSTLRDYNGPNLNTAKNQYVGICPTKEDGSSGGCMTLFDAAGNPIKDGDQFRYEKCSTGKSASNAMVSSRGFVETEEYTKLMTALGLNNNEVANVATSTPSVTAEETVGVWGSDTKQLRKIANPATTTGFKEFFTAYDQFREIRNSEFANNNNKDEVKVCVPRNDDSELVRRCTDVMNVQYGTSELYFNCMAASSVEACQQGIKDGTYDITTLGGNGLYTSYEEFELEPLVAEIYITGEPASYFGIGVVKASQCGNGLTFTGKNTASLQGKDSCHTGYRKTAGWFLPVGSLLSEGIIPEAVQSENGDVRTDASTVADFFGRVCAPRATDDGPKVNGEIWEPLCELCKESGGSDPCAANPTQEVNPYYDYTGAFKCMKEGSDDAPRVGWVKHTTLDDYNRQFPSDRQSVADYAILCTDGCRAWTEENYKDPKCNNGESASQAVIARAGYESSSVGGKVKTALLNGGNVKLAAIEIAGQENFFWSASTDEVRDVSSQAFEDDFFQAYSEFKSVFNLPQGGSPDAKGSVDVEYTISFANNRPLNEALEDSIEEDIEEEARKACDAAGTACPDADFDGDVTCTADCENSSRRSLLATQVKASGTVKNVVVNNDVSNSMKQVSSLGGGTVDQDQTKVNDSSSASMARMGLGGCIALVLGVLVAMA
uniref:Transferrin-like domain-containing protein n=1 Tax=Dunaliella tertiolecta TaxID=3047 RepID=A0A7S3QTH3_DUNTE